MTTQTSTGEAEQEEPALDVVEAWRRVLRDMPAVQKAERGQLSYSFRSIEQFTAHASVLCARHGCIVIPLGVKMEYVETGRTEKGAITIEARGKFNWRIYGPGGREDYIEATTFGQGRDSSDKGANKAATAAFKYLLMPALMISDAKEDPDFTRPESDGEPVTWTAEHQRRYEALVDRVKTLTTLPNGKEHLEALLAKADEAGFEKFTTWAGHEDRLDAAEAAVAEVEERAAAVEAQETEQETPQEPAKPKRQRARPGSAVTAEQEAAQAAVERAFPGTEDVSDAPQES